MCKRMLSLLLAACMLLGLMPPAVSAEAITSGSCGENALWCYEEETETLTISGTGATFSYVESISAPWYPIREKIRQAVVSPGITSLGEHTFAHLKNLQSLTLPEDLEEIGAWCFWHCESLPEIRLPKKLTHLGDFAFRNCYSLSSIEAGENQAFCTDASGVLYTREGKTLVKAPQKLTGAYTVPDGVLRLGADAFGDCGQLHTVHLPEGLTDLGQDAFYNCASLSGPVLPQSLKTIGSWCFGWCNSLRSITLPEQVISIGSCAFAFSGLYEITFTGHAPTFGEDVFLCTMPDAHYPGNDPSWTQAVRDALGDEVTWLPYTKNPFCDVTPEKFYYEAVLWAVEQGITTGTSATQFSPHGICTRAQVVTFLHRAAGSPEPANVSNPFTDVDERDYYYKAVLWAVEKGITTGAGETVFDPKGACTRAQVVTFLHRAAGSPVPVNTDASFGDISPEKYYYQAVLWAVEQSITTGTSPTAFSPQSGCTRAQIVTFLFRACEK